MKTNYLTKAALDWAVAKCEFPDALPQDIEVWVQPLPCDDPDDFKFQPSSDWAQGGAIIERECITVSALYAQKNPPSPEYAHGEWGAYIPCGISSVAAGRGTTPLIAAMRCYVASKLGDEVQLPEELL